MALGSLAAIGSAIAGAISSAANKGNSGKKPSSSSSSSKGSSSSGGSSSGSSSSSSSIDYNKGNGYTGRETAYTWKDNTTTYSNATNWQDAAREAGKEGVGLKSAVSYTVNNGRPTSTSSGGIYSSNRPTIDSTTGRNAYAQALADEAMAGSWRNPLNNGKNINSYGSSMEDFYNYYKNLSSAERSELRNPSSGIISSSIYNAIRDIETGRYVPENNNALTVGTTNANTNMLPQNIAGVINGQQTQLTSNNPYYDMWDKIESAYDNNADQIAALYEAAADAAAKRIEDSRAGINEQYEENARQAYGNLLRQQFALPGQLAASGVTGGAAQSANLALMSNYGSGLNTLLKEQAGAMKDLDSQINDVYADYGMQSSQALLENSNAALNAYRDIMNSAAGYDQWQQEFLYNQNRDAISDQRYETEWEYQKAQDELSRKQQELQLAISTNDYDTINKLGYTSMAEALKAKQAVENEMLQIELESARLGLKSDQLAYSEALRDYNTPRSVSRSSGGSSRSSSGSSGSSKPNLTFSQAQNLIEDGVVTDAVLEAYKYYTGTYPEFETPTYNADDNDRVSRRIVLENINKAGTDDRKRTYINQLYTSGQISENNAKYFYSLI